MCGFCEQGEHVKATAGTTAGTYKSDVSLVWQDGGWKIAAIVRADAGAFFVEEIRTSISVDYCPMCGRRLAERGQ